MYICILYLFQAPIQTANENHEKSNSQNDTSEMTLVQENGK
jgi:hypothetical protein